MSFRQLLDDLARERDRRAYDRDVAMTVDRIEFGGRPFHKAMSSLTGQLQVMTKSMSSAVMQSRAQQQQSALERLAEISAEGNELAATGKLSAYEGARLDVAIAAAADRIFGR